MFPLGINPDLLIDNEVEPLLCIAKKVLDGFDPKGKGCPGLLVDLEAAVPAGRQQVNRSDSVAICRFLVVKNPAITRLVLEQKMDGTIPKMSLALGPVAPFVAIKKVQSVLGANPHPVGIG